MPSTRAVASWFVYAVTGCGLVLLNKEIGTVFHEHFALLFLQTSGTCLLAWITGRFAGGKMEEFKVQQLCKEDVPGFVASALVMALKIATSFLSLVYVNTATYSVFKNMCVVGTAVLEWRVYGEKPTPLSWVCFIAIASSGAMFYAGDLEFSWLGYSLLLTNKVLEIGYPVLQRWLVASSVCNLKGTCTFWTNAVAAAVFLYFSAFACEQSALPETFHRATAKSLVCLALSVVMSFGISLATFFFIDAAGGTAFSFAGAVNKVPIVLLGVWLFDSKVSSSGWAAVGVSLVASFFYTWERTRVQRESTLNQHQRLGDVDDDDDLDLDLGDEDEEAGTPMKQFNKNKNKNKGVNNNNKNSNNNSNGNGHSNGHRGEDEKEEEVEVEGNGGGK